MAEPTYPFSLQLDEYEVANLREGLLFLQSIGGDTGDWLGQIVFKLPKTQRGPNKPVSQQKSELARAVGWRALWPAGG